MNEQEIPGRLPKIERFDTTDPDWTHVTASHTGQPSAQSPDLSAKFDDNKGAMRFHSLRVAEGLARKNVGEISPHEMYRQLLGRGVSKQEAAFAGLHPNTHDDLPNMTPSSWHQYMSRNLPVLGMDNQDGLNKGVFGNMLSQAYGMRSPMDRMQMRGYHVEQHGVGDDPSKYTGAVSMVMRDARLPLAGIHHGAVQGHGKPHIVHYKGFHIIDPSGSGTLVIDQVQSDWHQKKHNVQEEDFDPWDMAGKKDMRKHKEKKAALRDNVRTFEHPDWPTHDPFDAHFPTYLDLPFGHSDNGEWENLALRMALHNAAHRGFDRIALPLADSKSGLYWHNGRFANEDDLEDVAHVGRRNEVTLPREADKIAHSLRDLGVTRGTYTMPVTLGGHKINLNTIELTPEARRTLIMHGLSPFSSMNPRDIHRAIKALPIRIRVHKESL